MAYEQFETAGMAAMNLGQEAAARQQTAIDIGGFKATKDIEAERRQQERIAVAQADRQRAMERDAAEKAQKKSTWSTVGSLVGGTAGLIIGGPAGATAGATLGSTAGGVFGQEGGQVPSSHKFGVLGWENLEKRAGLLDEQAKLTKEALRPSLANVLGYAAKGFKTGVDMASFFESDIGKEVIGRLDEFKQTLPDRMARAKSSLQSGAGSLLEMAKGKATDIVHGRMDVSEGGARTMYKPGLLDMIEGAKGSISAGLGEAKYQAGQAFGAGKELVGGVAEGVSALGGEALGRVGEGAQILKDVYAPAVESALAETGQGLKALGGEGVGRVDELSQIISDVYAPAAMQKLSSAAGGVSEFAGDVVGLAPTPHDLGLSTLISDDWGDVLGFGGENQQGMPSMPTGYNPARSASSGSMLSSTIPQPSVPSTPFSTLTQAIEARKSGDPRAQAMINQAYSGAGGDWTTATQQFQSLFGGG